MTPSDKQELQTKGLFPMDEDHKQKGYHSKSEMKRVEMMKDEQSADIVQLKEQLTKSACMYVAQSALLDKAVAALEFYANQNNWIYTSYDICQTITPDDLITIPTRNPLSSAFGRSTANGYVYECGGKAAKQTLEEIKAARK